MIKQLQFLFRSEIYASNKENFFFKSWQNVKNYYYASLFVGLIFRFTWFRASNYIYIYGGGEGGGSLEFSSTVSLKVHSPPPCYLNMLKKKFIIPEELVTVHQVAPNTSLSVPPYQARTTREGLGCCSAHSGRLGGCYAHPRGLRNSFNQPPTSFRRHLDSLVGF